jgi:hypothetical protein
MIEVHPDSLVINGRKIRIEKISIRKSEKIGVGSQQIFLFIGILSRNCGKEKEYQ